MALQGGNLLVYRRHLNLDAGVTSVVTGIEVTGNNFSPDPQLPARLMIIVMPPTAGWTAVTSMSEPYFAVNGDLIVDFNCSGTTAINVLFWLPHTSIGPVSAEDYQATCAVIAVVGESCVVSSQGV